MMLQKLQNGGEEKMGSKSKILAGSAIYAALYATLVFVLAPISYREIQLRIADALLGLVPLMGWAGIVGHSVGVFISNIPSPLGAIDILNAIPSFIFAWLVWKLRKISVFLGLTIYSIALGLSVGWTLHYAFNIPLQITIAYASIGIFLSTAVGGYILYKTVKKLKILQRWFGE